MRPQTLNESLPGLRRMMRHFWPHIRRQRALIAASFLALFAEIGLRLLEPWPLKFVFDYIIPTRPRGGPPVIPGVDGLSSVTLLTLAALAVIAFTGLRALADYFNTIGFALIGNRVLTEVRDKLYRHLQCLSLSFHNKARGGDLIVRITTDIGVLTDVTVTAVLPLLANVLIMLGMIGLMFWLNVKLAVIAMLTLPLFWLSTSRIGGRLKEVSREQRRREGAMASTAAESIGSIKVVQALSLEGRFARAFSGENSKSLREGLKAGRLAATLERTVDILIAIATALVLWYGARLVLRQQLTPGELLVFLAYLKSTFKPMQDLAKYTNRLGKASAAGERILTLFEQTPEVRDLAGAVRAPAFRGAVRFERVSFAYEPGRRVLDGIEFEVKPGRHVALVGPSGGGKSTLVSLILRLYDPTRGRVMVDGRDIREYTLESLRTQISVVMQDSLLFAASVRDNIAYGMPDAAPEEIEAAARLANAHQFIEAMPEGYDTVIGERGVTLSGGQRQRIAIARAAVRKAPILVLDEPTSGLDRENEQAVVEALERLSGNHTAFFITHDLRLASRADLILYLEDGQIVERGTHTEMMRLGGRYAALYRTQAAASDDVSIRGVHALTV